MRLVAAVLGLTTITGCFRPAEWYELRVRDPSAASIEIETPHGKEVLLPPGNAPFEATLPRTTPPYSGVLQEASAIRGESGEITMRCDTCVRAPVTHLLPVDGLTRIELPSGPPSGWARW